ncbi:MAG TPA: YfhO family protein [Gemmatimonadaceae bacterium]|jgi:hypothetical protein
MARSLDAGRIDAELEPPPHSTLLAAVIYAISTMLLGYPALVGKFLVTPRSDQYIAGFAFRDFAAQSLKAGHGIPQWEPFLQGGMPYIAAMHGDIFYPTALLRWILPTDVAMTWEFIIHLFLCGLFTFFFLRAWRFGYWSALIGGLAYMLGGSIAGFASPGHDGKLFVATMLPAGLLLLTRGVRDGRRWAWPGFALVCGLAFLSPHPQLFQYFLLLCGSFTLYLAFARLDDGSKLPTNVALTRIGLAFAAVFIGIMLGAIQYWPSMIEYTPWSPRSGGHSYEEATSFSYPIEEILNWYWPNFSGLLSDYWGRNGVHLHSDYFGAVALMLGGAAFGVSTRANFRRFWIGVFVVSLIWALGGSTPLYHLIILVPYTKFLRAPSTMIYITSFATSVFVAMGIERIAARRVSPKYALGWLIGGAAFGLLMSVGGYTMLTSAVGSSMASAYPPEAHSQVVDAVVQRGEPNKAAAILGVWRSFLFVLLAAGLLWAYLNERVTVKNAIIGLAVLLVTDLWSIERLYWGFSPPASVVYATDPAAAAIKADIQKTGQPGRTLQLRLGQGLATEVGYLDRAFSGNKLWTAGLRVVDGYHGNELGSYQRMVGLSIDSLDVRWTPPFWRHENVQYVYTGADEPTMAQLATHFSLPPFVKLAGPVRNTAGSMVYAYKIPVDNPPAWVASTVVSAPPEAALATVLNARFDARTVAIADSSFHGISTQQITAAPAPSTVRASVMSYTPGAIDVKLDQPATAGQALLVSENYFPGWQATVNGKPATTGLTNYNLIGVPLTAGATTIELRFTDAAYIKGRRVTLVVLVIALAWLALALVTDRRGSPQVVPA